jgi:hypothetical protein
MLQTLPDCILSNVVGFTNMRGIQALLCTNSEMRSRAKPLMDITAVKRIRRFWRWCRLFSSARYLSNRFQLQAKLSSDEILSVSFEQLVSRLKQEPVVSAAMKFVKRIHMLCSYYGSRPNDERPVAMTDFNIRVLLNAYVIRYRPTHFLDGSNPNLETRLIGASAAIVECVDSIAAHIQRTGSFRAAPVEIAAAFPALMAHLMRTYQEWRGPDNNRLTTRIMHAIVALVQAEQHIPVDEPEDSLLRAEFRTQLARLREKLVEIADEAELARLEERLVMMVV